MPFTKFTNMSSLNEACCSQTLYFMAFKVLVWVGVNEIQDEH